MIHWLVQTATTNRDLARGIPPNGLLSSKESAKFYALKTVKRQQDWLLGRWTAKHLLQSVIQTTEDHIVALDKIVILNNEDGAPLAICKTPTTTDAFSLSISHSHGHAFCATVKRPSYPIGADIEKIEPRHKRFVTDYFTEAEIKLVAQAEAKQQDRLITAVWSAKEAALKALQLGLSIDTRSITCLIQPTTPHKSWTPFAVIVNKKQLSMPTHHLQGWWQPMDDFVLTMVIGQAH